ncbi:MAG TPA: hypothetical protein VLL76_09365, partial [Candidatus Omnitrophota bacterium]|nr:hypothetical protein [Candidatus Omnitrophota bacterium]
MNRPRRQQRFRHAAEGEGFLLEEFLGCPADPTVDPLESEAMPAGRAHARSMGEDERRFVRLGQRQQLLAVVPRPPAAGESLHIVGNGLYDFWTFVPQMIAWAGGRAEELYVSTWTAARPGVVELLELIDAGAIRKTAYLTGLYFKRRETAV